MSAVNKRPFIAVPCRSMSEEEQAPELVGVRRPYLESIVAAQATPLLIPAGLDASDVERLYLLASGVLLTGGEDVAPHLYGETPHPKLGQVSEERDLLEIDLARRSVQDNKPLLGICRGIQVINVAFGGTLYQDVAAQLPTAVPHADRGPADFWQLRHNLILARGARLASILDCEKIAVNSLHHQAVKNLGQGLECTGRAEDETIEAVELRDHPFALAVQCHPEVLWQKLEPRWFELFRAFVAACG